MNYEGGKLIRGLFWIRFVGLFVCFVFCEDWFGLVCFVGNRRKRRRRRRDCLLHSSLLSTYTFFFLSHLITSFSFLGFIAAAAAAAAAAFRPFLSFITAPFPPLPSPPSPPSLPPAPRIPPPPPFSQMSIPKVLSVSLSPTHTFSKSAQPSITLVPGHGVQGDCHAGATVQHRSRLKIRPAPPNLRQVHLMSLEIFDEVFRGEGDGDGDEGGNEGGDERKKKKKKLSPGDLGENITTVGIDLLGLGEGTVLRFVDDDDDHDGGGGDGGDDDDDDDPNEEKKESTREKNEQTSPPEPSPLPPPPLRASPALAPNAPAVRITGLRNPCPQIEKFRKGLQERFIVRDQQRKIIARKAGVMGVVESGGVVRPGMRIVVVVVGGGGNENGIENGRLDGGGCGGEDGFKPLVCV